MSHDLPHGDFWWLSRWPGPSQMTTVLMFFLEFGCLREPKAGAENPPGFAILAKGLLTYPN